MTATGIASKLEILPIVRFFVKYPICSTGGILLSPILVHHDNRKRWIVQEKNAGRVWKTSGIILYPSRLRIPDHGTRKSVFPEGQWTDSPEISIGYSITREFIGSKQILEPFGNGSGHFPFPLVVTGLAFCLPTNA
jgi:hypothetical protein